MSGRPLQVIRAADVRSVLNRALKPELKRLGFKSARQGLSGWARDVSRIHEFFWIQLSRWGFLLDQGGEFIVEFHFENSERQTSVRERMWRLLDDGSRREATRLLNQAIAAMLGPLPEIYGAMPENLRETHEKEFMPLREIPPPAASVWFRYATRANVEAWGEFVASRLDSVVVAIEERLRTMPEGTAVGLGR